MHNISFPNLGLNFDMNPEAFSIGTFSVYWYGIITALAFLVIIVGILKNGPKYGLSQDDLIDLMLVTTPIGIICARIFYVLVNWSHYENNLGEIYKIWHGGLAIYGGIVGGIITIYLFCRKRKISTLHLLDHIVVYLVLGQVVGRWGNFVNQELFGPNTNLPWAMTGDIIQKTISGSPLQFPGVNPDLPVHPLFLYESLWNLTAFFILNWFRKRKKLDGEVFSLYMISYGFARFTIDSLRFDLMVGNMNINRIFGLLFAVVFIIVFIVRRARQKDKASEEEEYEPSIYRDIIDKIEDEPSNKEISSDGETITSNNETNSDENTEKSLLSDGETFADSEQDTDEKQLKKSEIAETKVEESESEEKETGGTKVVVDTENTQDGEPVDADNMDFED